MKKQFEAFKRLKQETCPATYMPDFNKLECCDILEDALNALQIIIDKQVDMSQIIESRDYQDYIERIDVWFEAHTFKGTDKKQWFELYVLDEDEYNLVRSMI